MVGTSNASCQKTPPIRTRGVGRTEEAHPSAPGTASRVRTLSHESNESTVRQEALSEGCALALGSAVTHVSAAPCRRIGSRGFCLPDASNAFFERYGPWAFVAGASEGLGRAYSHQLADRGLSIVMVARNEARLAETAEEVREKGVGARTLALDLATPDLIERVASATHDLEIGLLVQNAGVSTQHDFFEADIDDHLQQFYVNCRAPVLLAHHFGRAMLERRRGGIILMSSVAGFVGSGLNALYGATKAFDTVLGEGLAQDLEGRGVDVLSMVAGATRTPQFIRTQTGKSRAPVMEPEAVVREALESLGKRPIRVAGANKAAAFLLTRLLTRRQASVLLTKASYAVAGLKRPKR